jgi:hypothetical protein
MGDDENKDALQVHLCDWCKRQLPSNPYDSSLTCLRCQHLLRNAGISDEEIFGKKQSLETI